MVSSLCICGSSPNQQISSRKSRAGQVMIEFVVIAAMLIGSIAIMAVFLYTFRQAGERVLSLVASEYP